MFSATPYTIRFGMDEFDDEAALSMSSIRRRGDGDKSAFETIAGLDAAFWQVIAQHTAGSPTDETLKWTNLTRQEIAELLKGEGIRMSVTGVDQLLQKHHYRRHKAVKTLATGEHPQHNQQFEKIARLKQAYQVAGNPVVGMDTKLQRVSRRVFWPSVLAGCLAELTGTAFPPEVT